MKTKLANALGLLLLLTVRVLLLLLLESLVELLLLLELSCEALEYSFAAAPVCPDWSEFAVAVCAPVTSEPPLLVGLAQAEPATPKAKPIADASRVLFMDRSSGG